MGLLVVRRYPTNLALGLADHTYVECQSGVKGWACFGGKTNGTALKSGAGSTRRADKIAGASETGGLKCYLINGVCHQAANRILYPAGILVLGARGYKLSESIYGPYGRPRGWPCDSPFDQHSTVSGDLPECAVAGMRLENQAEINSDRGYIEGALEIYRDHGALETMSVSADALVDLHVKLFMHLVRRELGSRAQAKGVMKLPEIRASHERHRIELEEAFFKDKVSSQDFPKHVVDLERQFQSDLASALEVDDYCALLGTFPGDYITLVDPKVAITGFGTLR
jgi:hypothetical protein